jgi:hypothetical protein
MEDSTKEREKLLATGCIQSKVAEATNSDIASRSTLVVKNV